MKIYVRTDGPAHALDARIMALAAELRRLVHARAVDQKNGVRKGVPLTAAHKAAIGAAKRGQRHTEESRWKMRQAHLARSQRVRPARDPVAEAIFGPR